MTSSISSFSTRRRDRAPFWSRRAVSFPARLVEAWSRHGGPQELPADEDELLHARRLVAQRCLYGVDRNPMAIDLARLSLWLVTLAQDHEFTFIDHALRHGDSLVGLTRQTDRGVPLGCRGSEISVGHRDRGRCKGIWRRVSELRQLIRELGDEAPEHELRELLDEADRGTPQRSPRRRSGFGGVLRRREAEGTREQAAQLRESVAGDKGGG